MARCRVAVITGSTRGWGHAVARGLAEAGISIVINGRNAQVDTIAQAMRDAGVDVLAVPVATDTPEGVNHLLQQALDRYGRVDAWVNSLGLQRPSRLLDMALESWNEILRVQLTSTFLGTQAAAHQMVRQGDGGYIINVVGAGAYGIPGAGAHAASKGGALAATYSWAAELQGHGITVNGIRGGLQSSGMRQYLLGMGWIDSTETITAEEMRALGFYEPHEAWPLAVWLVSGRADDVTGFHIGIDGARIVVYGRVGIEAEIVSDSEWTVESLDERLHPVLAGLPGISAATSQRRPPTGAPVVFDDRR